MVIKQFRIFDDDQIKNTEDWDVTIHYYIFNTLIYKNYLLTEGSVANLIFQLPIWDFDH